MPQLPLVYEFLIVIVVFILAFIFFQKNYGLNRESLAFKVITINILSIIVLVIFVIIALDPFDGEIIIIICLIPHAVLLVFYSFFYVIKVIRRQENTIRDLLNSSSEISIIVANIASEMAASVSEVNAISEEITSKTNGIASDSQEVVDSSNKI
ncbi:MAG: hypothetical protein ACFFC3_17370 [Candidatus Odinarchaeota archaeon]